MTTVVKHGNKAQQTRCEECECVFYYTYRETQHSTYSAALLSNTPHTWVNCPECGERCSA